MVPVGNAAAIHLSGLGGLPPLSSNSFFRDEGVTLPKQQLVLSGWGVTPPQQHLVFSGWGGVGPPAAPAFPGCIAPAPASQAFSSHVFPEIKSPC